MINVKAEQQALEQQLKEIMAQLHASQLECQILKNQGEIEGADTIRKRLVCCFSKFRWAFLRDLFLGRTNTKTT